MVNQTWLNRSMDDIVFENRNKSYGAYVLRRLYDENMTKGILVAISLCIFMSWLLFLGSKLDRISDKDTLTIITLDNESNREIAKVVKPLEPKEAKPLPPSNAIKYVNPSVVIDAIDSDSTYNVPTQKDLTNANIGSVTSTGPNNGGTSIDSGTGKADTTITVVKSKPKEEPVVRHYASVMPEFPDGHSALLKYFYKEFQYPDLAISIGVQGTLVVQFVVDTDGEVTRAKILRGLGAGCDEEALRVINNMPKWKPGIHNEKKVPVSITVPIKLVLK